ncbi:MAG: prolyl-tRNA synthetase associated domain-containing protein [Clostridia bacterium]|nr:prolyl-tRNA synthetase associated domain-containing protein [Clostridia bacterium]
MYTLQAGAPADARPDNEAAVYRFLNALGIPFFRIDHEPVHTMEDCAAIDRALGGEICKNLFLCNQQKTAFYLLMIHEAKSFKTKDISKQLGVSRLSFATPEHMQQYLHISPGAVSPMGLLFDSARDVRLILDRDILRSEYLGCHPCVNTASIKLRMQDFLEKYLPATGHEPTLVTVENAM